MTAPVPVDRRDADDATWQARVARLEAAPVADLAVDVAVKAAQVATREMAADWYCPSDERRPRITCRDCIAEIAARAAIAALKPAPGTEARPVRYSGSRGELADRVLLQLGEFEADAAYDHEQGKTTAWEIVRAIHDVVGYQPPAPAKAPR